MKKHIALAHNYFKNFLQSSSNVIDATCGNGKDSLFLSKLIPKGKLFCIDIQQIAIKNTKKLLKKENFLFKNSFFYQKSHSDFSFIKDPIDLIVYNLGYLPGSDKQITTKTETSIKSIKKALHISKTISITCYPGHEEGKKETKEIISFLSTINHKIYDIVLHNWINKKDSPIFIWIQINP